MQIFEYFRFLKVNNYICSIDKRNFYHLKNRCGFIPRDIPLSHEAHFLKYTSKRKKFNSILKLGPKYQS